MNKKNNVNLECDEENFDDPVFNKERKLLQLMCDIYEIQAFSNKNLGQSPVKNFGNNIVIPR